MTATDAAQGPNYPLRQIMLSFSYLAYCGQDITTPNPEAQILGLINAAMKQITPIKPPNPTWTVVWGPAVFTMPGAKYQDNMMFVANNNTDKSQYVIAIRGTNFISDLDWLMEDLDILQMIKWRKAVLLPPKISESTSIDLQVLLTMMKGKIANGDEMSVLDFLRTQTSQAINLCVTGHSLGGCVAGPFALHLKEDREPWDQSKNSLVCCVTFAAPTAGNTVFADYMDWMFNRDGRWFPGWGETLGKNIDAVRCTLDVAPWAWTVDALKFGSNIPTPLYPQVLEIYAPDLDFQNANGGIFLSSALQTMNFWPVIQGIIGPKDYGQVVKDAAQLQGTFHGPPPANDASLLTYAQAFIAQARYQHGQSYPILLNVPELNNTDIVATRRTRRPDTPVA